MYLNTFTYCICDVVIVNIIWYVMYYSKLCILYTIIFVIYMLNKYIYYVRISNIYVFGI